jgi:RNA polymerase sigma-70 factor (ECF subfamily)
MNAALGALIHAIEVRVAASGFEDTCLPFTRALYGTAVRLTQRPEDASDLVQETFLRAYQGFDRFREGSNAKAWLFTILHSVFVNRYRKARREPDRVSIDDVDERFLAARNGHPGLASAAAPTTAELESALARLPEVHRLTILLVDIEGFSYEEAADCLAVPVGTVRSRLFRGRKMLFVLLRGGALPAPVEE